MRRRAAQREGYDDVLFLNPDGTISEIATSNIGFIRGGQVVWPRTACLTGVTMTLLHQALDEPVTTEPLSLSDLTEMEAGFATNAAALDTCLARSDPDTHARFSYLTGETLASNSPDSHDAPIGDSEVRHPSDGRPMVKVDGSVFLSGPSNNAVWLPTFYIDVHPVSNSDYAQFVTATGHNLHNTGKKASPSRSPTTPRGLRNLE